MPQHRLAMLIDLDLMNTLHAGAHQTKIKHADTRKRADKPHLFLHP